MTFGRAAGLAAAFVLAGSGAGCGGGPPAPVAPAKPAPPDPNAGKPNLEACNEILVGVAALNALQRDTPPAVAYANAAGMIRLDRHLRGAANELRAHLARAAALDGRLTTDVGALDKDLVENDKLLEDEEKSVDASMNGMREIAADVARLGAPFASCTSKKDRDCATKKAVGVALDRFDWSPAMLPGTRAEIAKATFHSAELTSKRDALVARIDDGANALATARKEGGARKAAVDGEAMQKQLQALLTKCGVEGSAAADMAVPKTDWITTKDPELRKMVMIVEVVPEGRVRARLDDWAAQSTGIMRETFAGASLGGFGSGFYVMPREGETLIVTNRHVVDFGDRATLV